MSIDSLNAVSRTTIPFEPMTSAGTSNTVAALLPSPANVDVGVVVARMAIENAFTERKEAHADRKHANEAMEAAQKRQLAEMRREADRRFDAARLEAAGKIAEGGAGIFGGITLASSAKPDATKAESTKAEGLSGILGSGGKVAGALGSLDGAFARHAADDAGAMAKKYEMEAAAQKRVMDNAEDEVKEARDHARTALDFLRQLEETQAKSMGSAIRA